MKYRKVISLFLIFAVTCGSTFCPVFAETEDAMDNESEVGAQTEEDGTDESGNYYTLEAEQTYLEGKYGCGYSGNTTGTGMVIADDTDNKTASNGYYVGWLYYTGAYLSFEFDAEEDIDDMDIVFRLSAQYNDIDVTGDEVIVGINYDDDTGEYEQSFDFPFSIESYSELSSKVKDFQDYIVAEGVSVKAGHNTIELYINNDIKGVGGTMNAAAPLVDCLYLYTDSSITPITYNPEFGGASETEAAE